MGLRRVSFMTMLVFEKLGKTYHLIDPFLGVDGRRNIKKNYNNDATVVRD